MNKSLLKLAAAAMIACVSTSVFAGELVLPENAKLDKEGQMTISGTGFPANQELLLLITSNDGVVSELNFGLDPAPVTAEDGSWTTNWSYGIFVAKNLVNAGAFMLQVTDMDLNELGQAEVTFVE